MFLISSAVSAERYKEPSFDIEKIPNLIYASNVPHLTKKHFITSLAVGLRTSSDVFPSLYFYQNVNEITYKNLHFDLYQPKNDTTNNRPLVIVVHGGAFVSGSKDDRNQSIVGYCDSLAVRGYVVASIDYRVGLTLKNIENKLFVDSLDFKRAVQWGVHDLQVAIRFFRSHAGEYGIDREKIFVIGNSSGAILAMQSVCEKNGVSPNAIVSMWGAVLDKEKIKNVSIPVLLIHGTEDEIVPFKEGRILNLDSIRERNRDLLGYGSIASSFSISFTSPIFYGSYVVDSVFNRHGYVHETFFQDGVGHEFYNKEFYKIKVLAMIVNYLYKIIELDEKRPPSLWSRMTNN